MKRHTPVITFTNVTKSYIKYKPTTLKESLPILRLAKQPREQFDVLSNISFAIEKGQNIGVIGANGVGKSTILKLIAGITKPTKGKVRSVGRICPLIELGAGFHPDMTGRENIQINGLLLGLRSNEISALTDEIIAFSELAEFIDMPVKYYSSGMYMRLGFAIAVHAKPEILLIDEVLAVGDEAFQRKCLTLIAKLKESKSVTIVLVSHSLDLIKQYTDQCLFVTNHGATLGETNAQVTTYLQSLEPTPATIEQYQHPKTAKRFGDRSVVITGVQAVSSRTSPARVVVTYRFQKPVTNPIFGITIYGANQKRLGALNTQGQKQAEKTFQKNDKAHVTFTIGQDIIPSASERTLVISPAVADSSAARFFDWRTHAKRIKLTQSSRFPSQSSIALATHHPAPKQKTG